MEMQQLYYTHVMQVVIVALGTTVHGSLCGWWLKTIGVKEEFCTSLKACLSGTARTHLSELAGPRASPQMEHVSGAELKVLRMTKLVIFSLKRG